MFFKKGEWYEVSGGSPHEIVYADEEIFVSRVLHNSPGIGLIATHNLKVYSNKKEDFEGKYWIRKIFPQESDAVEKIQVL